MGRFWRYSIDFGAVALCFWAFSAFGEETVSFEEGILPLVDSYCVSCHNGDELEGDLDIERFETLEMVNSAPAVWERMAKRIENKEMPPKKRPQPTDEERALIVEWIRSLSFDDGDCNRIANEETQNWFPGYVMSRRLNRFEYENTVRDLLGIEVDTAELFPADGAGGEGFDTNGSSLFLSAIQVEKYLEAADLTIEAALPRLEDRNRSPQWRFPGAAPAVATRPASETETLSMIRDALIVEEPGLRLDAFEAAAEVLERFAERAWRRPVTPDEVSRLLRVFEQAYDRADGYEAALKLAFKAVLIAPQFVFLAEPQPDEQGVYALNDYPLASRLSYFIWGSMPDDELFDLADAGMLNDPEVLRGQVARMLRSEKSRGLAELFGLQWLGISQFGELNKPDEERFPEFDSGLSASMKEEAAQFLHWIVREDRSLLELIDSDFVFANEQLASIYGLDGVTGPELRPVAVDDPNRGGVLGMGAVLTATSHPLRTSPVLRGKWVMENLLGDRIPPPPPNAGTLPEDDVQPDGLTLRARLEAHRKQEECASCHSRIDPIGFGLENFDPIGRWRTEQNGSAIDTEGLLPSGESFNGPEELKAVLLKRKGGFAKHVSRKMLGYALGRSLTRYDQCVIDDCVSALQANEYRVSALVTEIVLSYPFRHRYSGGN